MTEAHEPGVIEEAAAPEATDMGNAHVEMEQVEEQVQHQETDQEMNFRKLRESNEQLQREREEYRQHMLAMQEELLKRQGQVTPAAPVQEVNPFEGIDPSDWTTFEQAQKVAESIAEKKARTIIEEYEAKRRKEEAPMRIKSRFQDFDAVVTEENVKQLQAKEPDVAQALSMIGDEEAQAVAAYKYIKAFVPQAAESTAAKQRIQKNANQPKSLSATGGSSPLSQASSFEQGLTPDLKKQLYAEMQQCARQS